MADASKRYTLTGADGKPYSSARKGTLGGHRGSKVFGRLDCLAARRAIASGGYLRYRVFFASPAVAMDAGFRPCAVCLPGAYRAWKASAMAGSGRVIRRSTGPPDTAIIRAATAPGVTRFVAFGRLLMAPARASAMIRRTRGTRAAS